MNFTERDNGEIRPEYVNGFRTYAGNGEVVLELSQIDLVATLKSATGGKEPESVVTDIKGRYVFRPEQIQQLIQSLISAISSPAPAAAPTPAPVSVPATKEHKA